MNNRWSNPRLTVDIPDFSSLDNNPDDNFNFTSWQQALTRAEWDTLGALSENGYRSPFHERSDRRTQKRNAIRLTGHAGRTTPTRRITSK